MTSRPIVCLAFVFAVSCEESSSPVSARPEQETDVSTSTPNAGSDNSESSGDPGPPPPSEESGASPGGDTTGNDNQGQTESSGTSAQPEPDAPSDTSTFSEARTYAALWLESKEECKLLQEHGEQSCYHIVTFCPDGTAAISWTDSVAIGVYARAGDLISGVWKSETPPVLGFSLDVSGDTLTDDHVGEVWIRDAAPPLSECD